jgi:hypothetical protein
VRLSERSDDICQRGDALMDLGAVARPLLALIDGWGSTRGLAARRVTKRVLRASPVARMVALAAAVVTVTAVVTLALVVVAIAQLV